MRLDSFLQNPSEYFGNSINAMHTIPREALDELHLTGIRSRFTQFRQTVPMLERLANNIGIQAIDKIDDVLPLLFDHATYKSYPATLLHNNRFTQLTAWLNKLTTHDLSGIDVAGCNSIDDWLMTLGRQTPLAVCHTSGSSGTMSFLPWSKSEWLNMFRQYPVTHFQEFGKPANPMALPLNIPCVYPFYRSGGMSHTLANDAIVQLIAGGEERFHCAYPQRLSADMLFLAARLRAAAAKGETDALQLTPELLSRRQEFETQQREMPQHLAKFFDVIFQ